MRIVSCPASIAVLQLAAILLLFNLTELYSSPLSSQTEFTDSNISSKEGTSNQEGSGEDTSSTEVRNLYATHQWLSIEQAEKLLVLEGGNNQSIPVDCCPSIVEMTAPEAGVNAKGEFVQLYKLGDIRQQFYEVSCKEGVADQPCRFMQKAFHNRSRCVQKYSYSYALVAQSNQTAFSQQKPMAPTFNNDADRYMMDHIQIRSGCSCEITSRGPTHTLANKFKKVKKTSKAKYKRNKLSEKT